MKAQGALPQFLKGLRRIFHETHDLRTSLLSIGVYQLPIFAYLNGSRSAVIFRHAAGVYHEGETLLFRAPARKPCNLAALSGLVHASAR